MLISPLYKNSLDFNNAYFCHWNQNIGGACQHWGGAVPPGPNVEPPLRRGDMTDSLRLRWKLSELSDGLTMLEIVGTRSAEHSLRSQVGIESHCLLGQLNKILEI